MIKLYSDKIVQEVVTSVAETLGNLPADGLNNYLYQQAKYLGELVKEGALTPEQKGQWELLVKLADEV